jgi:hypothetical protein
VSSLDVNCKLSPNCRISRPVNTLTASLAGTVALESYFVDKPVLMFGPTFFSHLIEKFESYKDLKSKIIELVNKNNFDSRNKKIEEIAKIYNITYSFFANDPLFVPMVMQKNNINNFLEAIKHHIQRLNKCKS